LTIALSQTGFDEVPTSSAASETFYSKIAFRVDAFIDQCWLDRPGQPFFPQW
jgi:hypothetical protein